MNYGFKFSISLLLIFLFNSACYYTFAQCITLGADLSYVNTIQDNNGIYNDANGNKIEPFGFFSEKGCDMVRLRLWHTPENITDFCGKPITSNNLEDVLDAAEKASNAGMQIMVAIHYGDYFNDPGNQKRPQAWDGVTQELLLDSIYNYTFDFLLHMADQGTLPTIVGIGNETTWGFIDETSSTNGWSWPNDAEKFNSAFQAVDDFNSTYFIGIKKAVHFTESTAEWLAGLFEDKGVENFDIIGISYYPNYSPETDLKELGNLINRLHNTYKKEVMIFETGFVWKINGWVDSYNNILNHNGNVLNYPASPSGQRDYLLDLAQTVYENNGTGVFYWEPAYISSDMCTRWGQGSPYENVAFFDYREDNKVLPAFDFFDFCEVMKTTLNDIENISIYPNPTKDGMISVNTNAIYSNWTLYDVTGRMLESGFIPNAVSTFHLDLGESKNGVYFLKLSCKNSNSQLIKIIIQNDF